MDVSDDQLPAAVRRARVTYIRPVGPLLDKLRAEAGQLRCETLAGKIDADTARKTRRLLDELLTLDPEE